MDDSVSIVDACKDHWTMIRVGLVIIAAHTAKHLLSIEWILAAGIGLLAVAVPCLIIDAVRSKAKPAKNNVVPLVKRCPECGQAVTAKSVG
jgi:fucose permease